MSTLVTKNTEDRRVSEGHLPQMRTAHSMNRAGWRLRMALGGGVCGAFAGIVLGALTGVLLGMIDRTWAYGLDGALFGGGVGIAVGIVAGLVLGWRDVSESVEPESQTAASQGASASSGSGICTDKNRGS